MSEVPRNSKQSPNRSARRRYALSEAKSPKTPKKKRESTQREPCREGSPARDNDPRVASPSYPPHRPAERSREGRTRPKSRVFPPTLSAGLRPQREKEKKRKKEKKSKNPENPFPMPVPFLQPDPIHIPILKKSKSQQGTPTAHCASSWRQTRPAAARCPRAAACARPCPAVGTAAGGAAR